MKDSFALFFALLRTALWGTKIPEGALELSFGQWVDLYNLCVRQGVHTLVWDALEGSGAAIPEELAQRWNAEVGMVEKGNALMDAVIAAQQKAWDKAGIKAILMKGQKVASYYPHPEHRLCGDIDWYFPSSEDWDKALALATRVCGSAPEMDSDGDVHYSWQGVTIEHHRYYHHLSSAKNHRYMDSIASEDESILELLMLSTHILRHAMVLGVSWRQVCDLAMAYKHYDGKYDKEHYILHLRKLGLEKWDSMLSSLMIERLDVPSDVLPAEKRCDAEGLGRILDSSSNLGGDDAESASQRRMRIIRKYLANAKLFVGCCPAEWFSRGKNLSAGRIALNKE